MDSVIYPRRSNAFIKKHVFYILHDDDLIEFDINSAWFNPAAQFKNPIFFQLVLASAFSESGKVLTSQPARN
jgi:hypothetical protein